MDRRDRFSRKDILLGKMWFKKENVRELHVNEQDFFPHTWMWEKMHFV